MPRRSGDVVGDVCPSEPGGGVVDRLEGTDWLRPPNRRFVLAGKCGRPPANPIGDDAEAAVGDVVPVANGKPSTGSGRSSDLV